MDHLTYYFQDIVCQNITNHLTDITKQSNNKKLFSESMWSCLAKVFSLHLGNDLYLEDTGEYPVLWRSSFFNSFPLIPLLSNSCSFILQNCIIPLWIIQGGPSSLFHKKSWRIPPKVFGVVSIMLAKSSTAFPAQAQYFWQVPLNSSACLCFQLLHKYIKLFFLLDSMQNT